jgi:hypothetical protein
MRDITVVIPTSVLPSHPSLDVIEETLSTVRLHLPDAEIIIQIDGLREEQQDRKADYDAYKTELLWRCLHKYKSVLPVVFDELHHQSGMLRETIDLIRTPLMLYVEGDCPLTPDRPIDWQKIAQFIYDGQANTVRLHHENVIPEPHRGLMIGELEDGMIRTYQWSQRPHLSSVLYYKEVVLPTLPPANFIEDTFHGVVANDWHQYGQIGWNKHRLWIYHPDGGIQRSYTTDGRQGGLKFTSDDEVWQKS